MIFYYNLTTWEAIDLLTSVMVQYFTQQNNGKAVLQLKKANNFDDLLFHCTNTNTESIANALNSIEESSEKHRKAGNNHHSKLVYNIAQSVQKGHPIIISNKQMDALLNYIGKSQDRDLYTRTNNFDPDYSFRNKFIRSTWEVFFWDFIYDESGTKQEGITRGLIEFEDTFRVKVTSYRPKEEKSIQYLGFFEKYKADFLKIKLRTTLANIRSDEDVSWLLYIGEGNINMALGQYRSVDTGTITTGTVLISKIEDDRKSMPHFFLGEAISLTDINENIVKYLSDKQLNFLKTPKEVTSIRELIEWFSKHSSRRK